MALLYSHRELDVLSNSLSLKHGFRNIRATPKLTGAHRRGQHSPTRSQRNRSSLRALLFLLKKEDTIWEGTRDRRRQCSLVNIVRYGLCVISEQSSYVGGLPSAWVLRKYPTMMLLSLFVDMQAQRLSHACAGGVRRNPSVVVSKRYKADP